MTTADTNPQANDGCSKEEAERRMMELQMVCYRMSSARSSMLINF